MKIDIAKRTTQNITFGYINKIIMLLFPFAIKTIILYTLGTHYLGLGSLYTAVLNVLTLAELGFSTAMVYSMYKPIAEDDKDTINALLLLYKKIYYVIGAIVLVVGVAIMPALPYLIKGDIPADINLYLLYAIYLANSVIGYFFFAYKKSLFHAHQENGTVSLIESILYIFMYAVQIGALLLFKNYYIYIIFLPITTLLINIFVAIRAKKKYPEYIGYGKINKDVSAKIKKQIAALFLHRIGYVIQASIDSICISAFIGLHTLGIFNNYMYIITSVEAFITVIYQSMTAGIGNALIIEGKENNVKRFNKITFFNMWLLTFCCACLITMYQPFMTVWAGTDKMLPFTMVICFTILFYTKKISSVVGTYKEALGLWWEDKFKPLAISAVNLVGTILCLKYWRLEGAVLTTAFAYLFVGYMWDIAVIFKHYLKDGKKQFIIRDIMYVLGSIICVCAAYYACSFIHLRAAYQTIVNLLICLVLPNVLFISMFYWTKECKDTIKTFTLRISKGVTKMSKGIRKVAKKIYLALPHKIVFEEDAKDNRRYKKCISKCKPYLKYVDKEIKCSTQPSNYVWTCWFQGEENAPDIVKQCINSVKKNFADKQVVVITKDNLKQYTDFPKFILDKWENGTITNTHFSDILRAELLTKHGGLWIDATVLCTGNLDKYIDKDADMFLFKGEHRGQKLENMSSWLIYSKANNPIITNTRNMLYKYWEKNDKLVDYFLFHIFFTMCTKEFAKEWEDIPFFTNIDPHILQWYEVLKPYNQKRFNQVKKMSNFHKLSYKYDPKLISQDSLFRHIETGDYK